MVRVVVDTNVLVSAVVHDGRPRQLVLELLDKHTIILSRLLLVELAGVLQRDKFTVDTSQVDRFVSSLVQISKIVPDHTRFTVVLDDTDDDVVLNVAYTGHADFIVTGDKHLLILKKFKKARILTVNGMLEVCSQKN